MDSTSRSGAPGQASIQAIGARINAQTRLVAVIPAAGRGQRSGLALPKQYHRLDGQTVLAMSIRALAQLSEIAVIVVVLDPEDRHWQSTGVAQELNDLQQVVTVAVGGPTRAASVVAGLKCIAQAAGHRQDLWAMVHDAARPAVTAASLRALWQRCQDLRDALEGAILGMPLADTVKRVDPAAAAPTVAQTLDRKTLWSAQTPQVFRLGALIAAYEQDPTATDEASAIERAGGRVHLVQGDASNIKLTTPGDIVLMEALMTHPQSSQGKSSAAGPGIAIGQGFDVHALTTGRPLMLGGVEIPFEKGLAGHSDADVLLHAITDAILGAAGLGDIGRHFPDTDPAYRGADSRMLLREAVAKVAAKGWQVAQIDATVIAQQPKIAPYAEQMVRSIADCVGAAEGCINIKGKTTEHLGFTGRGEGIAAQAVAMLSRRTA